MDFTTYLPDELGRWAKDNEIKLSRLLRDAVQREKQRREAIAETLSDTKTVDLHVEDETGSYTARLHGASLVRDGDLEVFLGEDQKLYLYDGGKAELHRNVSLPDLYQRLFDDAYYQVVRAVSNEEVIIDVGQAER